MNQYKFIFLTRSKHVYSRFNGLKNDICSFKMIYAVFRKYLQTFSIPVCFAAT